MHDINCPHCGKAFKIDEAGYADILKQVRNDEFEQQLHERLPGWNGKTLNKLSAIWEQRLGETAVFLQEHGRLPKQSP